MQGGCLHGGQSVGRGRELPAAAEGFQLEVGKAPEAIEIEEAAREAFLFRFLSAQLGF